MMSRAILFLLLFVLLTGTGCAREDIIFPDDEDFVLETMIQGESARVGEKFVVTAELINETDHDYDISRGGELILIQYRDANDPIGLLFTGPGYNEVLYHDQEYERNRESIFTESGEYKVIIAAKFDIEIGEESREYLIGQKQYNIFVE